ncbi:MAG TPA: hypothetical protein DCZ94_14515 [Lentisphaeria bacterium]|nr:MAG: hypothetical protein A2X48_09745 [Lentisphaerae bacterium GWF2_49_21]HBC88160.1 hypothetical protein [Lentisphaeria bacterium]
MKTLGKMLLSMLLVSCFFTVLAEPVKTVESSKPLWTFGAKENWTVWWPADKGAPVFRTEKSGDDAILTLNASDKEMSLKYFEGRLKGAVVMQKASTFTLRAELLSGEGVELSLMLQDAQNELLVYKPVPLKTGLNTITWDINKDITTSYSYKNSPVDRKVDGDLHLWEITVKKAANMPEVKIKFLDASCVERRPLLDFVNVEVDTGHPINLVILPEAKEQPSIKVKNTSDLPVSFKIDVNVKAYDGREWNESADMSVQPRSEASKAIEDKSPSSGVRWVTWKLSSEGSSIEGRSSWARMKPSGPTNGLAPNFLFSICTHASWRTKDVREREFLALGLSGCKVVRDGPGWSQIEREKGKYKWDMMDEMTQLADKHGMEIQGNPGNCAKWAASEAKAANPSHLIWLFSAPVRGWDEWGKFNYAIAERYKGKIRFWEMGNETDLEFFWNGTTDEYIKYLKIAYENVKKADPKAFVMTCGFSGIGPHAGKKLNPDMQERTIREAQDYFDIHAFHQHGVFEKFQKTVDVELPKLRSVLKSPKPLYFNETAMYSCTIGEKGQAEILYKKLLLTFARGAIGYTWYDLRNDGTDLHEPEHNFGMLTQDFHPKAVYVAFNTLTGLLLDKKFVKQSDFGADTYVFEFSGPSGYVVTGWVEKESLAEKLAAFKVGKNAKAATVDLMGNETELPVYQGTVLWPITSECRFLVVRGGDKPECIGNVLTLPNTLVAEPGKPVTLACSVSNPLESPLKVQADIRLPDCLKAKDESKRTESVDAAGSKVISFEIVPGRRPADAPQGKPVIANVTYDFSGTPWKGELRQPVMLKTVIPADGIRQAEPVFRMQTENRVTNIFANDPSNARYAWTGPKDLSAAVWLGVEGENLITRVEVTDDIHQQSKSGEDMWQGDSIQYGFKAPGQKAQWEFGLNMKENGSPDVFCWFKPEGMADPAAKLNLKVSKIDGGVRYDASIPLADLGFTREILREGIKFNLIVNDSDLGKREGWIHIAPGIGDRKDPGPWPEVSFDLP